MMGDDALENRVTERLGISPRNRDIDRAPFLQKIDGRHVVSCIARKIFFILLVMALLPVQPAQSADTAKGPVVNLTAEERAWLKAHPKIVFGVGESWAGRVICVVVIG